MNMTETMDAPPATVPVLGEKLRKFRIARHNERQMMCGRISICRGVDSTGVILSQLTRGAVKDGRPV